MTEQNDFDRKHETELVKEIGMFGIKTTITLCSGGFLVVLTFLGTLNESTLYSADIGQIVLSLRLLLVGIVCSVVTMLVSYLTAQGRLMNSGHTKLDSYPILFLVLQAGPLLIGFGFFVAGVWTALSAVSPL